MKSANVIAFLSEHSTRNPGVCLDELKIAVCVKGANIKTVLLEPENRIRQPATLSDIQWLDMSDWLECKQASKERFEVWYQEKFESLGSVIAQTIRDDLLRSVAEAMVEVGKIEIVHEDRLLQIMNLFHEQVDELENTISQSGQYSQRRAEILSDLKHGICALFL